MKLLVIGGGRFFGAALVDAALAAGHEVTAVQRGETSREAPVGLELLTGNRESDLPALLAGRAFDAVVDTCGYMPGVVQLSAEVLKDAGRYCFISSVSAYAPGGDGDSVEDVSPLDETAPDHDEYSPEDYGARKVQCERVIMQAFGSRGLVVRPGLIVGPNDMTDRFTYWPRRLSESGPILMPHGPDFVFQVIDCRDLADFVLTLIAGGRAGAVNAVGHKLTFADLVAASGTAEQVVYADDVWLLEREVGPWIELPLWLPPGQDLLASLDRALAWGLTPRPLTQTVADTLAWDRDRGLPDMPTTLSREREAMLLAELGA